MAEKPQDAAPDTPTLDPVAALQPLTPAFSMSTAWLENLSGLCSELASFAAERLRDDVKTQHAILHCKSFAELQHVQAQFLQRMLDQYAAETGRLAEIGTEMAANAQGRIKPDA